MSGVYIITLMDFVMKQLVNLLSLIIFFIVYKLYNIYYASGALIVVSALLLIYTWLHYHKVEKILLVPFILMTIFGLLTIYYHNSDFIKWKVTIIYILFAAALLINQFISDNPLIKRILDKDIDLPVLVWNNLNLAWSIFFFTCGTVNIYIAFWFPQKVWVTFKVFGLTGLTFLFTLLSRIYIYHHMVNDKQGK